MSLLVLGLSHHNAPLDLLERISLDASGRRDLAHAIAGSEHVREVVVVITPYDPGLLMKRLNLWR